MGFTFRRTVHISILPVTGFPLGSVTGTATGATVVTSWVTGFPLASKQICYYTSLKNCYNYR